jgi:hypothetical protein
MVDTMVFGSVVYWAVSTVFGTAALKGFARAADSVAPWVACSVLTTAESSGYESAGAKGGVTVVRKAVLWASFAETLKNPLKIQPKFIKTTKIKKIYFETSYRTHLRINHRYNI